MKAVYIDLYSYHVDVTTQVNSVSVCEDYKEVANV
jgi:hypothetical protein